MAGGLIRCNVFDVAADTRGYSRSSPALCTCSPMSLSLSRLWFVLESGDRRDRHVYASGVLQRTDRSAARAAVLLDLSVLIRITPTRAVAEHRPENGQEFAGQCDDRDTSSRLHAATEVVDEAFGPFVALIHHPRHLRQHPAQQARPATGDLAHTLHRAALALLGHQAGIRRH